jgi:cold shock CspA family protein
METLTMLGTIDRVVPDSGFGFIIGPNGEEYFFHRTGLKAVDFPELAPGVPVEFDVSQEPGDRPDERLRAVNVRMTDEAVPGVDNEPLPPDKIR